MELLKNIKSKISKRLFLVRGLDWIFNPVYLIRREVYKKLLSVAPKIEGSILDFGCGSMPYREIFSGADRYVGVDLEQSLHRLSAPDLHFNQDGKVPVEDSTFDCLIMFEVLDDLPDPTVELLEVKRILKPSGKLILTSSFIWEIHEEPHDYYRYTNYGIKNILEKDFSITEISVLGDHITVIGQLVTMYFYQTLSKIPLIGNLISLPMILVCNLTTLIFKFFLPKRQQVYHTNFVIAEKL